MRKALAILLILGLLGALAPPREAAAQKKVINEVMAAKLKNSQALLEGIALANYDKITRSAERLIQLSKTAEWLVYKTPRYEMHNNAFRRAAEVIVQKARARNIDGVALAYVDMTLSCVRCHQYVREIQDARLRVRPRRDLADRRDGAGVPDRP
jgi:hypothetical protein